MALKLSYDPEADAAYLRFSAVAIVESEEVALGIILDYGEDGRLVALEVLNAREHLPSDALQAAE